MKHLFKNAVLATLALIGFAFASQAQIYSAATVSSSFPSVIAASTTTALTASNIVIDVREQDAVSLQVDFKATGSSVSNLVITLAKSIDGTTPSTTAAGQETWTVAHNGTTLQSEVKTFTTTGFGYLHVISAQNTHGTQSVTNMVLRKVIKKPLAR
jgi:hypothetical protein